MSIKQNQIRYNPFVFHSLLNAEGKLSSIASLGCALVKTAVVEERWLLLREDKTKVNVGNVHHWGTEKCSGKLSGVSRIILLNE